jgi:nucleotide-binding universal stress UspA family protein
MVRERCRERGKPNRSSAISDEDLFQKAQINLNLNKITIMKLENSCQVDNPKQSKMLKNILVPVDFSDCSKLAIRYAVSQAKQFDGEITLLTVIPDSHTAFEYGEAEAITSLAKRKKNLEKDLTRLADEALDGLRHKTVVVHGRPFEEIVRTAQNLGTNLIVISTHGYPGETRVDLGSTTERVVRYATCPVLVVRSES